MSKRFGRNQKRKMRKAIEHAQSERDTYKHWYEELSKLARRNQQIVEDTADVLGQHFMTLDPSSIEVRRLSDLCREWQIQKRPQLDSFIGFGSISDVSAPVKMERAFLPILRSSSIRDELEMKQHFRFAYRGRQVGYAISEQAIAQAPRSYMVKQMADEMARMLVTEMQGGRND